MRIVRIQSRICAGGPAFHSILLSEGLSHRAGSRYETILVGGGLEPDEISMEDFAASRGVSVRTVRQMRRSIHPWRDLVAIQQVTKILQEVRPHIVHTHTAKAGAIGRVAAYLTGVPVVLHTFHGHVFEGYFSSRRSDACIRVERFLAAKTDRILAVSEKQRSDLVYKYQIAPPHKVQVVPLGLDLARFRSVPSLRQGVGPLRQQLGIDEEAQVAVAVGRLVPIKRFDVLLEAFRKMKPNRKQHLVIVGDGECRAALEAQAVNIPNVYFLGFRRDLPEIYGDADLMVLSSDNEGTPVAVIEALVCGLPVVATNVGGIRDILREGMGTMVERGDINGLKNAINMHLTNPFRITDLHREDVFSRYSHRRLLSDMEIIYDSLVRTEARDRSESRMQMMSGV